MLFTNLYDTFILCNTKIFCVCVFEPVGTTVVLDHTGFYGMDKSS